MTSNIARKVVQSFCIRPQVDESQTFPARTGSLELLACGYLYKEIADTSASPWRPWSLTSGAL